MGNGGSMTKKHCNCSQMSRKLGSGITSDVYTNPTLRPTDVLKNVRLSKSRLPKKYIVFE